MAPDDASVVAEPRTGTARVLALPGHAYVAYFDALGSAQHQDSATLTVPGGDYDLQWFDPSTAQLIGRTRVHSAHGALALPTPSFTDDVVALVTKGRM